MSIIGIAEYSDSNNKYFDNVLNFYDSITDFLFWFVYIYKVMHIKMKLLLAISLMFTVLGSEFSSLYDVVSGDTCLIDVSYEGESESETKESTEDITEFEYSTEFASDFMLKSTESTVPSVKWVVVDPFLEIHSPPPEV